MNDLSPELATQGIPAEMVETFTHLLFGEDTADAGHMVEELFAEGLGAEALMLDLLAPSARLMGELWCADRVGFMEVTIGLSRIQKLLRQFQGMTGRPALDRGTALLVPVPGEQHSLGLRVVEEFLIRDGWRVQTLLRVELDQILQLVAGDMYDFVGFSVSGVRLLPDLRSAIRAVRGASRNRGIRIMVGGALFADPGLVPEDIDADAVAADAHEAVEHARGWFEMAGSEVMIPSSAISQRRIGS